MRLFNFLKKSRDEESNLSEIRKEDFIDETDPVDKNEMIRIQCGTGKPIDVVYAYLEGDYDIKGYEDAICVPDNSYKEKNKVLIRSKLEVIIKRILQVYESKLREIDFHIESRRDSGLFDIVKELESTKKTFEEHKETLIAMEKEIQDDNIYYVRRMLDSYDCGFLKGLAALSLESIQTNKTR
jgi:hypothetical protein